MEEINTPLHKTSEVCYFHSGFKFFPPYNESCMDSVIAKLYNVKWKEQKNQFIEHSDPALMCNAVQTSQYKPIINVSDQPTNSA